MTIASDLLQRRIQTFVDDNAQWQALITDNILWELAYAPAIGHLARLSGREEVVRHVAWFLGAVEKFPPLRPQRISLSRSGSGSRRSQGGGAYQANGAYLSPGASAGGDVLPRRRLGDGRREHA
jgi:hypothetical protein